jgi:peptidylprolyl isomerase
VVQWGDPDEKNPKSLGEAKKTIAPEFTRAAKGFAFTKLPDPDTYAPETGFSAGFPAARDPKSGRAWLVHCYAMVGVGRDNARIRKRRGALRHHRQRGAAPRSQHHGGGARRAGHRPAFADEARHRGRSVSTRRPRSARRSAR